MKTTHIVFAGGGTAGHLFPGLAVAEKLAANRPGVRISFAGSGKRLERELVAAAGFDYLALASRPLPRKASEAFGFVVENMAGYFAAGRFLDDEQVAGVVGLGGYASVPLGRAAARRRLPMVLLEQNAVLGRANRFLSRFASLLCTSFQATEQLGRVRCPVRCTGNPTREFAGSTAETIMPLKPEAQASRDGISLACASGFDHGVGDPSYKRLPARRLIVLGGSGGARSLNENVPRALYKMRHLLDGWQIVHQSGEADLPATRELYRKLALDAQVEAFWADMPQLIAGSSLAICRAGGTTLAELALGGTPALLLPYPQAADDHQRKNAEAYVAAGAAELLDEREVSGRLDDCLAELLGRLVSDATGRENLSRSMGALARPQAAAHVAGLVWSLVTSQAHSKRARAAA